jgi:FtsH-binding integral membrane protein
VATNAPEPYNTAPYILPSADLVQQRTILNRVYAWMTAGLAVTAATALLVANNDALQRAVLGNRLAFLGLILVELAAVWILSTTISRMPFWLSTTMFLGYALLNGLTLSLVVLAYTRESIASTFFATAGTFGLMSLYGFTTKRDLTSIGNLCLMGLVGFIVASIVNIFLASPAIYWVLTFVGILVFVGLTAYDTQKIKNLAASGADEGGAHRLAILGALTLYLDFINLFLLLLRIFGRRR